MRRLFILEILMIYKILTASQWEDFYNAGEFKGTDLDLADGYIHMSYKEQVSGVLERYFKSTAVYILAMDEKNYKANIKVENGFPHIYNAPILYKDVVNASF